MFYYGLIMMFLSSCGGNKLVIENSHSVIFEYDQSRPINYGDTLSVTFYNVNGAGERTDISTLPHLRIYGEGLNYVHKDQLLYIKQRPKAKDVDEISFLSVLKRKDDSVYYSQKIKLDFSGQLTVDLRGSLGGKGSSKLPRLRSVLDSDGKTGKDAEDGTDGGNAQASRVHIWKEADMYYVRTEIVGEGTAWYYQTTNKDNVFINNSGGDGGNGGNGGDGSRGSKGSSKMGPGNGGDGGNGGNAGNGGNGADIEVVVHPTAKEILPTLIVLNKGGKAGDPGDLGKPGKGGKAGPGQKDGEDGKQGLKGAAGISGLDGSTPVIRMEDFDFEKW